MAEIPELWSPASGQQMDQARNAFNEKHGFYPACVSEWIAAYEILVGAGNVKLYLTSATFIRDPKGKPLPWRCREMDRMPNRKQPVWVKEKFWSVYGHAHGDHYVHVSETNPRLLAYTVNEDKGERDIQTPIKPGRYLSMFFKDVLSAKKIAWLAAWQASGSRPDEDQGAGELKFATTPDDIATVYIRGPYSCMDGRDFKKVETHPCRVYGAGDLAVAYLELDNKIIARCLTWPEKKVAGRVYPTPERWQDDKFRNWTESQECQDTLVNRLKALGYTFILEDEDSASFNGARILRVPYHGGYLMPYMDNQYGIIEHTDSFEMSSDFDVECDVTDGYILSDIIGTCQRCEEGSTRGSSGFHGVATAWSAFGYLDGWQDWCERCKDEHSYYCHGTGANVHNDMESAEVDGFGMVCKCWADENCLASDRSGKLVPKNDTIIMNDGAVWEYDEFKEFGFICALTKRKLPVELRHPDHPEIAYDLTDEQLKAYLAVPPPVPGEKVAISLPGRLSAHWMSPRSDESYRCDLSGESVTQLASEMIASIIRQMAAPVPSEREVVYEVTEEAQIRISTRRWR
jgi:hypothetical protein